MKENEEKEMLSFLSSTKRDNNVFFLKQKKMPPKLKKKWPNNISTVPNNQKIMKSFPTVPNNQKISTVWLEICKAFLKL